MDQIDKYLDRIEHLPPAPGVATELLDLFRKEEQRVDRVVELITYDPSLTTEVLKRCNSAFFRGGEPIKDIFSTVTRVGMYEVYCVVVSMFGSRTMEMAKTGGPIDAGALWRHSIITAVAAGILARRAGQDEATAFTAGLLHDVGKLVFTSTDPVAYSSILKKAGASHGALFLEAEQSHFGVTHASVGGRLLARWGLPGEVDMAVGNHHSSPRLAVRFEKLAATVNVANAIAHEFDDTPAGQQTPAALEPGTLESVQLLGLAPEVIPDLVQRTEKGLKRVEALLTRPVDNWVG